MKALGAARRVAAVQMLLCTVAAANAAPVGTEFQVNTYTTGDQQAPDVAVRPDGSFVVVWDSEGSFGSDTARESVQARLLDAGGEFIGAQFQVNELTAFFQYEAAVAARPDGGFVVVWDHLAGVVPDPSRFDVRARIFDLDGVAQDSEFTVNAYTSENQTGGRIVVRDDATFVVAWRGWTDGSGSGVLARPFSGSGVPEADDSVVNEFTPSFQNATALAQLSDGTFVVAWHSYSQTARGYRFDVVARELDATLSPTTPDLAISSAHTSIAGSPAVASQGAGRYVVVWQELEGRPLRGQRMAAGGTPVGEPFALGAPPPSIYSSNARARLDLGPREELLATWHAGSQFVPAESPDGDAFAIMGRFLGKDAPLGAEFVLNSYTTGAQYRPTAAFGKNGRALVVWQSRGGAGSDTDGFSIQARFVRNGDVFMDGFESGGLGGWSAIWPDG